MAELMEPTIPARKRLFSPAVWGIVAFTACYMGIALAATVRYQNVEFKIYLAVMLIMLGAVLIIHNFIRLNTLTLMGLSIWGAAHMAGGLWHVPETWTVTEQSRVLYNWWVIPGWLKFDQLVHFNGFGLVTWICWQGLRSSFERRGVSVKPTFGLLTLCVAAGTGFGAFNEVIEFTATRVLSHTNVGGYANTGWDLVANLLGSMSVAIGIWTFPRGLRGNDPGGSPHSGSCN